MDNIPTWVALVISSVTALIVAILVQLVVVPWQRKKILGESRNGQPVKFTFGDSDGKLRNILIKPLDDDFHSNRFVGQQQPEADQTTDLARVRDQHVAGHQRVDGTAVAEQPADHAQPTTSEWRCAVRLLPRCAVERLRPEVRDGRKSLQV